MLLHSLPSKLKVTIVYSLSEWNGYVIHVWVYLQQSNDSLAHDLFSENSLTQFWCAMDQSYLNLTMILSLSAFICFHLLLWAGVEFWGGERESVTLVPPCFSHCGHPFKVLHFVFTCFFFGRRPIFLMANEYITSVIMLEKAQASEYCFSEF